LDVEYCIVGAGFAGCKSIPLDEPWDRTTLAQWLDDNVKSNQAHGSLEMAVAGNRQLPAGDGVYAALHHFQTAGQPS
jgi:hypothetical protein